MKKEQLIVRIPQEVKEQAKVIAKERGITLTSFVRNIIENYIKRQDVKSLH